jgi:hypothetical protein
MQCYGANFHVHILQGFLLNPAVELEEEEEEENQMKNPGEETR